MEKIPNAVLFCVSALTSILCAAVSNAQPPDPFVGTWKVNVAKSKYTTTPPASMTVTFAPAPKGYAVTIDMSGPDGQPQKWGYTSSFDGSENAVWGNPNIDTVVARTKVGTVEYMKAGKVITTTQSVMSDDGNTLMVTVKMPNPQGKEVTNIVVYERQ